MFSGQDFGTFVDILTLICVVLIFLEARKWQSPLESVADCTERRDAKRDAADALRAEADRETIETLRTMSRNLSLLASEMTLMKGATRSLVGTTERLMQRIERAEALARGDNVPELEQRRHRTAEENDLIASRGE